MARLRTQGVPTGVRLDCQHREHWFTESEIRESENLAALIRDDSKSAPERVQAVLDLAESSALVAEAVDRARLLTTSGELRLQQILFSVGEGGLVNCGLALARRNEALREWCRSTGRAFDWRAAERWGGHYPWCAEHTLRFSREPFVGDPEATLPGSDNLER